MSVILNTPGLVAVAYTPSSVFVNPVGLIKIGSVSPVFITSLWT